MENVIGLLIPLAAMGVGALGVVLEHKRKMAMIDRGIEPESKQERISWSLVITALGAAITLFYFLTGISAWLLLAGLIALFVGIAKTVSFFIKINNI